ncbi:DNA polymerase I [Candidatus Desantisbacteria bacterium CG_4_10_14_0_8_um_filter_48_22]|uniref:DNA polymerase I n=1 Tax=Candidatus Desantisbacteria bacterium CG_4_10_14_0_8_um_filter_48_22 TaxID=1974543 RepID=A0A2M7SFK5_9BACT|nr:MAG: DNA polymerase I [Candidatus Desantisbacteria bacterium CG02_land_8_20_14_3_00_49_13]PIZ18296.1 MAG: DNA polymerase I [Candidatus Desantisbacteria bacterium CG_4_10_14_0_8_um_filter_48_22]PJB28141.1 MAG: DNA polymerase I [Candidatus Desantisbacteria bacterium CG_4_9_14_3_um_filter_50_7]
MKKPRLFIIDGQNLIYRAFYALPRLTNSKGTPTGAAYGFSTMVLKILKEEKPDCIGVAFDLPGPTFRHKIYKEYKATRQKTPEEISAQIPIIKEIVKGFRIPIIEKQGFEADDCIGTIAVKAQDKYNVVIVTGDKDALQLVNSSISVMNRKTDVTVMYDAAVVKENFGVEPENVIDMLALAGDASDNIPGVKGIGEKTAEKLIAEFKNIEGLLANLDKVTPSVAEKIKASAEDLKISRELVKIDTDVPLGIEPDSLKVKEPDREKLRELFTDLEFTRLLKEMNPQEELFAAEQKEEQKHADVSNAKIKTIEKEKDLDAIISRVKKDNLLAFDLTGTEEEQDLCVVSEDVVNLIKTKDQFEKFKPLFENSDIKKIGYNLKDKVLALLRRDISVRGLDFDATIARYLLEPEKYGGELADAVVSVGGVNVNPQILGIFSLREDLKKRLEKTNLKELFDSVEMPLIEVLAQMELDGIKIDPGYLKELGKRLEADLSKISKQIFLLAGEEFNINSPKVLGNILFEKLKLPPDKKTKTGYSTNVDVLKKLAIKHELPQKVLDFRQIMKLKSTYVDALPELIRKETGRVHSSFNQTGTVTGRLSSSEPNMQNMPVKTELGREIRRAFISEKGRLFISADYSQIELRVLAHLSEDQNLVESFSNNEDIHLRTASEVFGVPLDKVSDQMRNRAKVVNFGIVYGMSSYGLSQELGISREEAQQYIDTYFLKYKGVAKYISRILKEAAENGYVRTLLGRIRFTPNITSQNRNIRQFAERIAINSPIQGTASDLIKLAMVNIFKRLGMEDFKTRLLLQIHDELLFEAPEGEVEQAGKMIMHEMQEVYKLKVPLKVDIKTGTNWRDLH